MKLLATTKFIAPIGLVIASIGATAVAAPLEEGSEPAEKREAAPTQCPGMKESEGAEHRQTSIERQHAASGPLALFGDALQKVCLDDEQRKAIEELGKNVTPHEEKVQAARHALRSALLEQIQSGRIDESELRDEVDALVKAREEASPVLRKAIDDLHEILDSGQRDAFVDALESRMGEIREESKGWLDELQKDLRLTDEQKGKLREALDERKPALKEERERFDKVLDAFEKDDFSVERAAPKADVGERTRRHAEGMVGMAKKLVEVLSPEQRKELASRLGGKKRSQQQEDRHGAQGGASTSDDQPLGETAQPIIVGGGGYRAGAVRGWGGGYGASYSRGVSVSSGYSTGYPLVAGYGPGIW